MAKPSNLAKVGLHGTSLKISHQARMVTKFIPGIVNFEAVMHRTSNIVSMHSFNRLFHQTFIEPLLYADFKCWGTK